MTDVVTLPDQTPMLRIMTQPHPKKPDRSFAPVAVRARHDGWTTERQIEFIKALAECGCVADAARRVGISAESAYRLRRRFDAAPFRLAWDAALDFAIRRLSDAAYSRAIHGVAVPHYYKGELVGEHRRYDDSLTRFLLRYRDPPRYAHSLDKQEYGGSDELLAIRLARMLNQVEGGCVDFYEASAAQARGEAVGAGRARLGRRAGGHAPP
ncbi:MAG: hypothetical protein H0X36_14180 [Sphingomonadaceae bacterium]|jgi:hypothetical protein|nr:hypothetical protein [Sphingomonadaceae bacterium]